MSVARRRSPSESREGQGEHARIVSPLSGKEWTGRVIRWTGDAPQLITDDRAEVRYFPPDWVRDVYTPDAEAD